MSFTACYTLAGYIFLAETSLSLAAPAYPNWATVSAFSYTPAVRAQLDSVDRCRGAFTCAHLLQKIRKRPCPQHPNQDQLACPWRNPDVFTCCGAS
ncbi:hypothetical protein BDW02DRAFT_189297 [Decorospora gaudefroyi]|uniref:Secreted protein n=1 Tax=Decorospora gaudefroyi TaxID=184978 RepID=A0A6A5KNU1_9PLEO|nr:hypothetical protein BDW02DRAFT_189297 [Decorospora gaudefroyi]